MYIDGVLRAETDAAGNYELSNMSTGKCRVVVSFECSEHVLKWCIVGTCSFGNSEV